MLPVGGGAGMEGRPGFTDVLPAFQTRPSSACTRVFPNHSLLPDTVWIFLLLITPPSSSLTNNMDCAPKKYFFY